MMRIIPPGTVSRTAVSPRAQRYGMQAETRSQIDGSGAGLRGQRQGTELRVAAGEGGIDVADHPGVNRTQVMGVVIFGGDHDAPLRDQAGQEF
jgi:hypothetical protein